MKIKVFLFLNLLELIYVKMCTNEQIGKTIDLNLLLPIEYKAERLRYHSCWLDILTNISDVTFLPSFYININLMGYMVARWI